MMSRWSLLVLGLCSMGCDDDDEGYRPWDTGIDDTVTVSTIDGARGAAVCESLGAHLNVTIGFEQLARLTCLPQAVLRGGTPAACAQFVDTCTRARTPPPVRIDQGVCLAGLSRCDASLGALEACVNVNVSGALDLLEALSCARIGEPVMLERASEAMRRMSSVQGCADVSARCEGVVSEVF